MSRNFTAFAAALSAAFFVGNANAIFIVMDDFGLPAPAQTLADPLGGGATLSAAQIATPSGFSRQFSHELLAGAPGPVPAAGNYAKIGSTTFPSGSLEVANTSGHDSQVKVMWNISAGYLAAYPTAQFGLYQYATDGNPVSVALSIGATNLGMINLPTSINANPALLQLFPAFTVAQMAAINAGGVMTMTLDGNTGWDLALDSVGFQIPEPTSLALVGLALIGAAVASRRRAS